MSLLHSLICGPHPFPRLKHGIVRHSRIDEQIKVGPTQVDYQVLLRRLARDRSQERLCSIGGLEFKSRSAAINDLTEKDSE